MRPVDRSAAAAAVVIGMLTLAACSAGSDAEPTALATAVPSASASRSGGTTSSGSPLPLTSVRVGAAVGTTPGAADGHTLQVPSGWTASVWAHVSDARMAAWTPDGRLLVTDGGGDLTMLTPGSDPAHAPTARTLVSGLDAAQGIAVGSDGSGGTVVVLGEQTRIDAWDYADGRVSNRRTVVSGLPGGGRHPGKFVALRDGVVAYDIGSSTNRDPVDRKLDRATIWTVGLDGSDNTRLAVGVRNGEGLSFAPDGTLFAAVNQDDDQPTPYPNGGPDYIAEHPNDQVSRITAGTDLGWPFCVPDSRGNPSLTDLGYVDDPVNNQTGSALDCASIGRTMLGLPAHSAPIGFVFTNGSFLPAALGNGALITAHGSWDRQPPRAPSVAYSPWDAATKTLGPPQTIVTGFQNTDGSRWGRSVDAVPGPDGAVYVTDDQTGLVYRVAR
jgi:glucose/arabinose dehydrogenase